MATLWYSLNYDKKGVAMCSYRRVAYEDRCQIVLFLLQQIPIKEICRSLGFHKTTIYREIQRNKSSASYVADIAHIKARMNFRKCRKKKIITKDIKEQICDQLKYGFSPEQIAGRWNKEGYFNVSHSTIYRSLIYKTLSRTYLRRSKKRGGGRYKQRKAKVSGKTMITERPKIVEARSRIGDWERDTAYAASGKLILVLVDRATRFVRIEKIESTLSEHVAEKTKQILEALGKTVYTVTNDNGPEFSKPEMQPYRTFYCQPHKPHQRGTVENTIGLIRQYITRKTNLDLITRDELTRIQNKLNFRPRKCLDFQTPFEAFYKTKVALAM